MDNFEKAPTETDNITNSLEEMPTFEERREQIETFNKFADFFKKDSDIKRALNELAPSEQDTYGDGAIKYSDKLYAGTRDIVGNLKGIMQNFYHSEDLDERLKQIETDVINAGADGDKLTSVYNNDFAAMSKELNDGIHQEVKGYYLWSDPHKFDKEVSSVNEALHLIHTSIVNDERFLHSLPVLESSEGQHNKKTTLYGTATSENPVAKGIYEQIKNNDETLTDIVSLPDRTLMMVRDRGHALTVDVEKDEKDGKFYVNYFVPKICNVEKVNKLPGVRPVQDQNFTTGVFSIENEADVANAVVDFIKMVPTDNDMVF